MVTETSGNPTFLMLDDDSFCFCLSFSDVPISCAGATNILNLTADIYVGSTELYWEFYILDDQANEFITSFTNLDFIEGDTFADLCERHKIIGSQLSFTDVNGVCSIESSPEIDFRIKIVGRKLVSDELDAGIELYIVDEGSTPCYEWVKQEFPQDYELRACLASVAG